jgi:hypothetical protein
MIVKHLPFSVNDITVIFLFFCIVFFFLHYMHISKVSHFDYIPYLYYHIVCETLAVYGQ